MKVIGSVPINWNELLWRYFRIDRFVELMNTSKIYFSSAYQFEDPFEGAVFIVKHSGEVDLKSPYERLGQHAFEELKRLTKINCWHRSLHESDAMWKIYAARGRGIAICSTPERIRAAAKPFRLAQEFEDEALIAGYVQYVDLTESISDFGFLERFFIKHVAFSWEQEFRLAISLRLAEEFGVNVPDDGIRVEISIDSLIEAIWLGPSLTQSEVELVVDLARRHGVADRVKKSSMTGIPLFTPPMFI